MTIPSHYFSSDPNYRGRRRNRLAIVRQQKAQRLMRKAKRGLEQVRELLRTGDYDPREEGDLREVQTGRLIEAEKQFSQITKRRLSERPKNTKADPLMGEAARPGETNEPITFIDERGNLAVNARRGRRTPIKPAQEAEPITVRCAYQRAMLNRNAE